MAEFATIAAYTAFGLGIVNSCVTLTNLWRGTREPIRSDQRRLRQQLRELLLDVQQVCEDEAGRQVHGADLPKTVPNGLRDAESRVQEIRRQALLMSPNDTHLEHLRSVLDVMAKVWDETPKGSVPVDHSEEDLKIARLTFQVMLSYAQVVVDEYLNALAKIDKNSYVAYFRYKNSDAKKTAEDFDEYLRRNLPALQ